MGFSETFGVEKGSGTDRGMAQFKEDIKSDSDYTAS